MTKTALLLVGISYIPLLYIAMWASGMYTPFRELFTKLIQHYRSDEPFGVFD